MSNKIKFFLVLSLLLGLSLPLFSTQEIDNKAVESLLKSLKSDPRSFEKLTMVANHYFGKAVDYEARYLWGKPKKNPENKHKATDYSTKAIEYLERAIAVQDKNANIFAKLADAYGIRMRVGGLGTKMKYMGKFKSYLGRSLEIDPENMDALITKAYKTLYSPSLFKNRNESAKEQFEKLLKRAPKNPHIIKGLAIVYKRMKKYETARELIMETLEIAPKDLEAMALKEEIEERLN